MQTGGAAAYQQVMPSHTPTPLLLAEDKEQCRAVSLVG